MPLSEEYLTSEVLLRLHREQQFLPPWSPPSPVAVNLLVNGLIDVTRISELLLGFGDQPEQLMEEQCKREKNTK